MGCCAPGRPCLGSQPPTIPWEAAAAYSTPAVFTADWLNLHCVEAPSAMGPGEGERPSPPGPSSRGASAAGPEGVPYDDYRFVYLGPAGSWMPLHVDVLRSYSWSANVCGRKHWVLFPPSQSRPPILPRGEGEVGGTPPPPSPLPTACEAAAVWCVQAPLRCARHPAQRVGS
jgi:hypothetical protein